MELTTGTQKLVDETRELLKTARKKKFEAVRIFNKVRNGRLWEGHYRSLNDFVKKAELDFGNCNWCLGEISRKKNASVYRLTCSKECQIRWLALGRADESRYWCARCKKPRLPHSSHKSGLCFSCKNEVLLLKRRPDIENIGKCVDCERKIVRDAIRCRNCGAVERWKRDGHKAEVLLRRKLNRTIGSRIRHALKRYAQDKKEHTIAYLGCSLSELTSHLEARFTDGMNWQNHGLTGWHIDHIRPISSFDFTKEEDIRAAFHYTNLQPLWWWDNLKKRDHYE